MNNLIIVGNGFDLAHGLKTNYSDFVNWLFTEKKKDPSLLKDLFIQTTSTRKLKKDKRPYRSFRYSLNGKNEEYFSINILFTILVFNHKNRNWGGIEKEYFDTLVRSSKPNSQGSIDYRVEHINDDFNVIKSYLEEYLTHTTKVENVQKLFDPLFNSIDRSNSLILSFNYTQLIEKKYFTNQNPPTLINIHGELNNTSNPIIFGYAADYDESSSLLDLNNLEFLKNIKRYNYKKTLNFHHTQKWLSNSSEIMVHIIGHSCGISDKLILSEILNHESVKGIYIHYYETVANYKETLINIDRIVRDPEVFQKIMSFEKSIRTPQTTDNEMQRSEYNKLVDSLQKDIEKHKEWIGIF